MKARIVSVVFQLPTALREEEHVSFTMVVEIKRAPAPIQPDHSVDVTPSEDDYTPECVTWNGRILKRTVPFLCVGDN